MHTVLLADFGLKRRTVSHNWRTAWRAGCRPSRGAGPRVREPDYDSDRGRARVDRRRTARVRLAWPVAGPRADARVPSRRARVDQPVARLSRRALLAD